MKPDSTAGLETLRSLQVRFLRAVRDGEWTDAQQLQEQRFALMDILVGETRATPPALAVELAAILGQERELLPQVEHAREQVAGELREMARVRKAMNAYEAPATAAAGLLT